MEFFFQALILGDQQKVSDSKSWRDDRKSGSSGLGGLNEPTISDILGTSDSSPSVCDFDSIG